MYALKGWKNCKERNITHVFNFIKAEFPCRQPLWLSCFAVECHFNEKLEVQQPSTCLCSLGLPRTSLPLGGQGFLYHRVGVRWVCSATGARKTRCVQVWQIQHSN